MEQEKDLKRPGQRHLKIQEKAMPRAYKEYAFFPEIKLCGKWLHDMGFTCGQSVLVQHEQNKIVITLHNSDHPVS